MRESPRVGGLGVCRTGLGDEAGQRADRLVDRAGERGALSGVQQPGDQAQQQGGSDVGLALLGPVLIPDDVLGGLRERGLELMGECDGEGTAGAGVLGRRDGLWRRARVRAQDDDRLGVDAGRGA